MKWYCFPGFMPAEERAKVMKDIACFKRNFIRNGEGMTLKEYLACKFANMAVAEIKQWPKEKRQFHVGCDLPFSACNHCGAGKYDSCMYEIIRCAIINVIEIAERIQPELDSDESGAREGGEQ
jgi:hypothetical protein